MEFIILITSQYSCYHNTQVVLVNYTISNFEVHNKLELCEDALVNKTPKKIIEKGRLVKEPL